MSEYNIKHIVSFKLKKEEINKDYQLIDYRSIIDFFLGKPKRKIIRFCGIISIEDIELNDLDTEKLFIRDNTIWNKAKIVLRFSNGTISTKYFDSNEKAILYSNSLKRKIDNSFITI